MKAGGFGRYQCFLLLMMIISNNGPGLVVYGVAYYELEPPYICTYNSPQFEGHLPDSMPIAAQPSTFIDRDYLAITGLETSDSDSGENIVYYSMSCDTKTVCASGSDQNTALVSYRIDTESMFYIKNWVE